MNIKQIFCKHKYGKVKSVNIPISQSPNCTSTDSVEVFNIKTCSKCGKEQRVFIRSF